MSIQLSATQEFQEFYIAPMSVTIYDAVMSVVCPLLPCGQKVVIWSGDTFVGDTLREKELWGTMGVTVQTNPTRLGFYNYTGKAITIPGMDLFTGSDNPGHPAENKMLLAIIVIVIIFLVLILRRK